MTATQYGDPKKRDQGMMFGLIEPQRRTKVFQRVHHHYEKLEEAEHEMWRVEYGEEKELHLEKAAGLMKDPSAFRDAMIRAVFEWPNSCEHNLTCFSMNRRAWMGHAGCLIGAGSPEATTRLAWHTLTTPQQDAANRAADEAIAAWERKYRKEITRIGRGR